MMMRLTADDVCNDVYDVYDVDDVYNPAQYSCFISFFTISDDDVAFERGRGVAHSFNCTPAFDGYASC